MDGRDFSADSLASMGDAHSPLKPIKRTTQNPSSGIDARLLTGGNLAPIPGLSALSLGTPHCMTLLEKESPALQSNSALPGHASEPEEGLLPEGHMTARDLCIRQDSGTGMESLADRIRGGSTTGVSSVSEESTAGKWRSASDPVRSDAKEPEVNPVLLRFISNAHLFEGSSTGDYSKTDHAKPNQTQPMSPVLLKQGSLTKLQLSPSFKHKATLERSLSSNLSLKKPIRLMQRPAPLPDAISPAQLARSDSDSPAFFQPNQGSPFNPIAETPGDPPQLQRQVSSGSEAFSVGGNASLSSEGSGGSHLMGSLNAFYQTDGGVHSQYSANQGLPAGGYGGNAGYSLRGENNLSGGSGGMVQLASAHPVLAPRFPKFFAKGSPGFAKGGQTAVSSQVHPMSVPEGPVHTKAAQASVYPRAAQAKPGFGSSLKKMVFKTQGKSAEIVRDPEIGAVVAAPGTPSGEVWSDVHIQDSATQSVGWRKPFADPHYVPHWSAISTEELISQPAPLRIGTIMCYLIRNKDKKHPTFWLYTQENTVADRLLLVARFNSRGPVTGGEYVVSKNERGLQTKDIRDGYFGRVRSNFSGSRFQFYDHTVSEKQMWTQDSAAHTQGAVSWESTANALAGGWRKMGVAVKALEEGAAATEPTKLALEEGAAATEPTKVRGDGEPGPWSPRLWDSMEKGSQCHCLVSKEPEQQIDEKGRESFFLQYGDRCNFQSKRNFQLVSKRDPDAVVCLMGKVEPDVFTLDYSYPLSAFQAFCIALTSINEKWCFAV